MNVALANANDNVVNIDGAGGVTISSVISGASRKLTKGGAGIGVLTLAGVNTYSGDTTITAGTLALSGAGSIANSPNIVIAGGATFDVSGLTTALTLANGQGLKATGTTTSGTIATTTGKGLTTAANSPLQFTAFNGTTPPLTITGAGTVALAAGNVVTVTVANGGTPLPVGDYVLIAKGASGSVTGAAPTSLTVNGDNIAAGTAASLLITGQQLVLRVAALPAFSIDDVTHAEGDAGQTAYTFTVTKTGTTAANATVDYVTANGTAVAPADYTAAPAATLIFLPADVTKQFTVQVNGDTTFEPDEAFTVALSNPSGATIADASGTGTITNDDVRPAPAVVYVDDDFTGANGTDPDGPATEIGYDAFPTIQGGVTGVAAGGTVNVAAGEYSEQPVVGKSLTLVGAGAGVTNLSAPATLVPRFNNFRILVEVNNGANVEVSDITVKGPLNLGGCAAGTLSRYYGIYVRQGAALNLHDSSVLDIRENNPAAGTNCRLGTAVNAGTTVAALNQVGTVTMNNVTITGFQARAVIVDNAGSSGTITNSTLTGSSSPSFSQTVMLIAFGANAIINGNQIGGAQCTDPACGPDTFTQQAAVGISLTAPAGGVQITNNTISNNDYGINNVTNPGDTNVISGNTFNANRYFGVHLSEGNATVSNNTFAGASNVAVAAVSVNDPLNQTGANSAGTLTGNTITGATVGLQLRDQPGFAADAFVPQLTAHFNRIVATTTAIDNPENQTSDMENNWWGCNAGPGNTGCGAVTGAGADFAPWFVFAASATPDSIAPGGTSAVAVDMTKNSDGVTPASALPALPVAYSATNGTMSPTSATVSAGVSGSTFTSTNSSSAVASVTIDNETVNVPITVTAPAFSIDDVTHDEGDSGQTSFTFTITKTGTTALDATVSYETVDGTAASPSDFTAISVTPLTFLPAEMTKEVTVFVNGDAAFEPDEQFSVSLSNPSNATLLDAQGVGTITNDDDAPQNGTVQFSAAAYAVNEGIASATVTVTRTGGADEAAGVTYATSDGTATAGEDYTAAGGTLNWAAGDSAPKTFTVSITGDAATEPNETVILTLSAATGATLGTPNPATLDIIDNDGAASTNVVVVYPTALQGWAASNQATAAGAFVSGPGTPPYGSGSYQMTTGAGTGGAGAGGKHWFKTDAYNGTRLDAISQVSYRTYVDPTSTATDNLAPVLEMMVDVDGNGTRDTTLVFEPVYTPEQGAVQKGVWQTWNARTGRWRSTRVVGPIVPDTYFTLDTFFAAHPDSTVVQWFPFASAGFGFGTSVGQDTGGGWAGFVGAVDGIEFGVNNASTLNDFELAPPTISITDVTLAEGDADTTSFVFDVTLSGPSSVPVTVDYTTQDGTATVLAGDYAADSGTLNFAAGETAKTVTVLVNGDTAYEADETFNVQLSNPTGGAGAGIADADGAGTITNDDAAVSGSIEFVSAAYTVSEAGGPAQITVQRTGGTDGQATATFSTANGTATAGQDYTAVAGEIVTYAHGEGGMKTIDVPVSDDSLYEGDETVNLSLTTTTITLGPNAVSPLTAVLTITDDEAVPTVTVSSPVYVSEPETGTTNAVFTFTLSGPAGAPVTLDYQTQDGTATAPDDYTAIPSTQLTFAPSQTTQTVSVVVKADSVSEGAEQFTLALSNVSANATLASTTAIGRITDFVSAGALLISEFRLRGAGGSADEYVELYNNTNSDITVGTSDGSAGWTLAALSPDGLSAVVLHTIPASTVIRARSYYLVASEPDGGVEGPLVALGGYTLGGRAAPDAVYTGDVADASGVALFRTSDTAAFSLATRFDAAGFTAAGALPDLFREGTALPSPGPNNGEYAFFRTLTSGRPADTDDNAADFTFVSTDAGTYGGVPSKLGAPGPQNSGSPIVRTNLIKAGFVDPGCMTTTLLPGNACARYRDHTPDLSNNSTFGTLSIRRKFTNTTTESLTRLRFRVVDATVGTAPLGTADMRLRTSPTFAATPSGGGSTTIEGLTLEQPPTQDMGGGLNSTVAVGTISLTTPLAAGNSVDVHFLLGIQQPGTFRFFVSVEALKESEETATLRPTGAARRKSPRPAPKK